MAFLVSTLQLLPSRRTAVTLLGLLLVLPLLYGYLRQRWQPAEQWIYRSARNTQPALDRITAVSQNTFDHTEFYKPLRRDDAPDYCSGVSQADIADLVQSLNRPLNHTIPVVYHFQGADLITPNHNGFKVGSGFCTVALVPQAPLIKEKDRYENQPVNGTGPDQIHAELASPDVRLMITQHPEYWGIVMVQDGWFSKAVEVAVYAMSYNLYQPGEYWFKGEVEHQHYNWLMEDWLDFRFVDSTYDMVEYVFQQLSPPISVTGAPVDRPTTPCYTNGLDDLHGRWYRASSFNNYGNMTALNPRAVVDWTELPPLRDNWGWTFAPDACQLVYFNGIDHAECLENKVIHATGDSNSRRVLKSLIGGGNTWCPGDDLQDRWCQCEDYMQYDMLDVSWQKFEFERLQTQADHKLDPFVWGRNTTTFFDFVGGVVNPSLFNGWVLYYDGKRFLDDNTTDEKLSVAAERNLHHGTADIVYLSMVTWDVAALRTPAETLSFLPEFRHKVFGSFPESTKFVIRLGSTPCCGNTGHRTRFAAIRTEMWNAVWQQFFSEDVRSGRVKFIDPSVLQARREAETEITCTSNHLRVSHVRVEQMMWMNAVCEHAEVEVPPPYVEPPPLPKLASDGTRVVNGTWANGTALEHGTTLKNGTTIYHDGEELTTNGTLTFQNGTLYHRPALHSNDTSHQLLIPSVTTRVPLTSAQPSSTYTPTYTKIVRLQNWHTDL